MLKIIGRIGFGVLAVVAALALLLAASVAVDAAAGGGRIRAVTNTAIPGLDGGPEVRAYIAQPEGAGPFPAVILIHEFYGLNESITGKAEGLAEAGYVAVAPDTFRGATTAWLPRAIFQVITTPQARADVDLDAVFAWLRAQPGVDPGRIAIAGFCYGGRTSLLYSLHNPDLAATVVFYGSPVTDPQALRALPGPLLGIFGGADPSIPVERVRAFEAALDEAGVPNEITVYEGQPHAFVQDMASIRAGGAQGQAWGQMLDFLGRALEAGGAAARPGGGAGYRAGFDWRYYLVLAYAHAVGHPEEDSN